MQPIVISVYTRLLRCCSVSVDDILVVPALRERFLNESRLVLGDVPESDLLRCLINLRKRSKLPRASDIVTEAAA